MIKIQNILVRLLGTASTDPTTWKLWMWVALKFPEFNVTKPCPHQGCCTPPPTGKSKFCPHHATCMLVMTHTPWIYCGLVCLMHHNFHTRSTISWSRSKHLTVLIHFKEHLWKIKRILMLLLIPTLIWCS